MPTRRQVLFWQQLLRRSQAWPESRGRKRIRRNRCASWSASWRAGNFDIVGRLIAQSLSEQLHQPFIVENRPGASSNLATEAVVRAPADGYTLLLGGAVNAVNATLYDNLGFNFISDLAPVAGVTRFPNVMTVNALFPGQDGSRIHRLRESKSGKDQPGLFRQRDHATSRRRVVQDHDRRRFPPCPL
jgi:hypothetical protein